MRKPLQWQRCVCKDCSELAPVPEQGGKSHCDECKAFGCPDSGECLQKQITLHADMLLHPN